MTPNIEYDLLDFDSGPSYLSSSRKRQYGYDSKNLNENLRPLKRFLKKSVGKKWDDVYSEIKSNVDHRKTIGFHVLQHLSWNVAKDVILCNDGKFRQFTYSSEYFGLYIDDNRILRNIEHKNVKSDIEPITSINWFENTWFILKTFKRKATCGCIHFKSPDQYSHTKYATYPLKPDVCIHGNEPILEYIWFVTKYKYHQPNEVYRVDHNTDGEVYKIYYADVPDKLTEPVIVREKMANRKELKIISTMI